MDNPTLRRYEQQIVNSGPFKKTKLKEWGDRVNLKDGEMEVNLVELVGGGE